MHVLCFTDCTCVFSPELSCQDRFPSSSLLQSWLSQFLCKLGPIVSWSFFSYSTAYGHCCCNVVQFIAMCLDWFISSMRMTWGKKQNWTRKWTCWWVEERCDLHKGCIMRPAVRCYNKQWGNQSYTLHWHFSLVWRTRNLNIHFLLMGQITQEITHFYIVFIHFFTLSLTNTGMTILNLYIRWDVFKWPVICFVLEQEKRFT